MIEVAGLWELGWSAPLTESDQWWTVMREFEVQTLNMTPVSGIQKRWVQEYPTLEDILENKQELTPVFIDEKGDTELEDFVHPENALYILGKATYSPFTLKSKEHLSVKIHPCNGMLWPHQALAIVLYHRRKQRDNNISSR